MATRLHLALFFALTACTTRTVVDTAPADGGAAPAPVVHATPNAPDAPDTEDEATDTSPPAPRPAEKRGEPGADSGAAPKEVMTGGHNHVDLSEVGLSRQASGDDCERSRIVAAPLLGADASC
jgi:hypothetical protein